MAPRRVSVVSGARHSPGGDPRITARLEATLATIRSCLRDVCGDVPAMAVEHFAPSTLALRDPRRYESALRRIAPATAGRLVAALEAAVAQQEGLEPRDPEPLFEFIERVSSNGGMRSIIEP